MTLLSRKPKFLRTKLKFNNILIHLRLNLSIYALNFEEIDINIHLIEKQIQIFDTYLLMVTITNK